MSGYRPIADTWILARPKVRYYGSYPAGFLERARALLGVSIDQAVLHVCAGKVRDYPFRGVGPNDRTVDLDPSLEPDFVQDVREPLPLWQVQAGAAEMRKHWDAILADPPYSAGDADHYTVGRKVLPTPGALLRNCLEAVKPGGRVGMLHYQWPRPPKVIDEHQVRTVAVVGVLVGFANNIRCFSVFEKVAP